MNGARRAGPTPRGRVSGGGSGGTQREGQNPGTGGCRDTLEGRKIVLRGSGEAKEVGRGPAGLLPHCGLKNRKNSRQVVDNRVSSLYLLPNNLLRNLNG